MKALALMVVEIKPRLIFLKSRSKSKVKVIRSKVMVSNERFRHKVSTCEI